MKYQNKRNGKIATLVSEDNKFKTVMLELEDGSTMTVSLPTFKRWWKVLDEEPASTLANQIANDFEAEEELTDDEYAQIGKEIAQQAKQKAEDAKNARAKQKASGERPIDVAHKICKQFNQFNLTTAKNNVGIHVDKKRIIDIWGRSTKIRIYVSEDNAQFKTLNKKLYVVEGFAKGNLNKSIYVESANIEAVLTHLLNTKEAK